MKIDNHRIDTAERMESKNVGSTFQDGLPDTIVLHYTNDSPALNVAKWLCKKKAKASAHLVVGRDGSVYQLVDFDRVAWHAGVSSYRGRTGLNQYSIGIEMENWGEVKKVGDAYVTWRGTTVDANEIVKATHRNQGQEKYWQTYTQKQIETVFDICDLLTDTYSIKHIVGHEEIAPERKTDPGPAFPLDKLRGMLLEEDRKLDEPRESILGRAGLVNASALNVRSGPGGSFDLVMDPLPEGTRVDIQEEANGWYRIRLSAEGWVSKNYITTV